MISSGEKLLTRPEPIDENKLFYPTGNEYIALPENEEKGGIKTANLLRFDLNGMLEFSGSEAEALLSPLVSVNGEQENLSDVFNWHYDAGWIPCFETDLKNKLLLRGTIATPPGYKGFLYILTLKNRGSHKLEVEAGWQGCWANFNLIVFSRRSLEVSRKIFFDTWTGSLVLEAAAGTPLAALALSTKPGDEWLIEQESGRFSTTTLMEIEPGEEKTITLYGSINLEADGAATTNVDLRRHGSEKLLAIQRDWLSQRYIRVTNVDFEGLLNRNLFFCYYYSTARFLDTDQIAALTSRSPRYYVSAAFWSRDALLWSFPAILLIDQNSARSLLLTLFSRHAANAGEHAHYLNGTILYPGFELDQLAAYLVALDRYLMKTDDYQIIGAREIQEGLTLIAELALQNFDPNCGLYSTFLDPSDDPADYPYLTYNNALLQRAFCLLADLQRRDLWFDHNDFATLARELEESIYEHSTVHGPCGLMFAWAVDGKGKFTLYDNPPGSLQLLAHYRFCSSADTVFKNTVRWIRSPNNRYFHADSLFEEAGSLHCGNPWPLGACNNLLAFNAGALDFLKRAKMDNGFFCETVDPETGKVSTGAAFASAAGFLAYTLYRHFIIDNPGGNSK